MSFAKAKIKRFNDITVLTPPPTKYNVIATPGKKGKSEMSSQLQRFLNKIGSPPGSEINSVYSTPCFQTPATVTKKKKFLGLTTSKNKSVDIEALREKIVECSNKDAYIQELIEQIEELKGKECQMKTGNVQEMLNIRENYEREYEELRKNLTAEIEVLKLENDEYKRLHENLQELHHQNLSDIVKFRELDVLRETNMKAKDVRIKLLEELEEKNKSKLEAVVDEIQCLQTQHEIMTQQNEEVTTKLREEITELKELLKEQKQKSELQEENHKEILLLNDLQTKEKIQGIEHCWQSKLQEQEERYEAILKEFQAVSEYNIIQCEVEKNCIKNQLVQKAGAYQSLKLEYDDLVNQVKNQEVTIEEMTKALKENGLLLSSVDVDILAYEISIKSFKETIEVLKKRLLDSDRDVMQLKNELELTEEKAVNYESQINELNNQLRIAIKFNEELEMQSESTQNLVLTEVRAMEKILYQTIDQHMEDLQTSLQSEVTKLQEEKHSLNEQVQLLQNQLQMEIEEAAEVTKKYIDISGKYDQLSQKYEENAQNLNETRKMVTLTEPFRNQLELYAQEIKELKKEGVAGLTARFKNILQEQHHSKIEEMLKITESELKKQQENLEKKNSKLESHVAKLKHDNEELRKQVKTARNSSIDKENMASPLKSLHVVKSPAVLRSKN